MLSCTFVRCTSCVHTISNLKCIKILSTHPQLLFFLFFSFSHTHTHLTTTTQRASYTLEAIAEDKGTPPLSRTVEVEIDVVDRSNKPPVWDQRIYGPIYVKENTAVGETVTSVKARSVCSSNKPVF